MMGGGYKEPPKFLYRQKLHHSGDGINENLLPWTSEGDYNERDFFTAVHINDEGNRVYGFAQDDDPTRNQGAIYEFSLENGTWTQTAKITGSISANTTGSYFGQSCCRQGDYLFVGAPYSDDTKTNSGIGYVFHSSSTGWTEVQKIGGSGKNGDNLTTNFGTAVAVSEDGSKLVFASSTDSGTDGGNQGALYVFESGSSGYVEIQRIEHTGLSGKQGDRFGTSMAINSDGTKIVAGAAGVGYAFVFESGSSGYEQVQMISGDNGFGVSLDMDRDGQKLVVGSRYHTDEQSNQGAVYVYDHNGSEFSLSQTIIDETPELNEQIGIYVKLAKKGTGASTLHLLAVARNATWTYDIYKDFGLGDGMVKDHTITNPSQDAFARLGSVFISKNLEYLVVSAPQERDVVDGNAYLAGAIHLFEYSDEY